MVRVREGRIEIDFTAAERVERLDRPGVALPHGMAFVDFVVEETSRTLLVEIKDPEGAPDPHRARARREILQKMESGALIHHELVPKARDSYTFLHLMRRDDGRDFVFVCVLGVGSADPGLLGDFKNRLLRRLRREAEEPWIRRYVMDCIVVTPLNWARVFPEYPIAVGV